MTDGTPPYVPGELTADALAAALRAGAGHTPEVEAATELLIAGANGYWLTDDRFRRRHLTYFADCLAKDGSHGPLVVVRWHDFEFDFATPSLSRAAEDYILRFAAALARPAPSIPNASLSFDLGHAISKLSDDDVRHVLTAIARRKAWHQRGISAVVPVADAAQASAPSTPRGAASPPATP